MRLLDVPLDNSYLRVKKSPRPSGMANTIMRSSPRSLFQILWKLFYDQVQICAEFH